MNNYLLNTLKLCLAVTVALGTVHSARGDDATDITISKIGGIGRTQPILISLSGFTGEALSVLKFDLTVQGFKVTTPDLAQYQITGGGADNLTGNVVDKVSGQSILSRNYSGASLRRQAHFFANDIVQEIMNVPGIGLTKIAFKKEIGLGHGEIYIADFDGYNPQPVTHDNTIVAAPCWVPGRLAVYYTSYYPGNPDIYYDNLSTGQRAIVAKYSGLNTAPAVSPDGSRLAMVLSRSGSPNIWVENADGSNPQKLTSSEEDSSPCWSPDGQWICFATKIHARRLLAKVSASGGEINVIHTPGFSNPTEPDWSPDNKWIAFTTQAGSEFDICVVPVDGASGPIRLVPGEDPSWSANSRTLIFTRRVGGTYALSVLDVMTKQVKDIKRTSGTGNDSQPAWAR